MTEHALQSSARPALLGAPAPLAAGLVGFALVPAAVLHAPAPLLLALHTTHAALVWLAWRHASGLVLLDPRLLAMRAALLAACFPVVGGLAVWLARTPRAAGEGVVLGQYREYLAAEAAMETPGAREALDLDEALRRELAVAPLVEVLRHGDLAAKQRAAQLLVDEGGPGIAALRAALVAPDDETRLFSSLALVKAEEDFTTSLAALRAAADAEPGAAEPALAAARGLRRYVETGLPTGGVALDLWRELERQAGGVVARADGPAAMRREAWLHVAAARHALEGAMAARAAAREAVQADPADLDAWLALGAMLFEAGELDELAGVAREIAPLAPAGSDAAEVAAYWGTGGER